MSDRQKRMLVGLVSGLLLSLIVYSLSNSPGSFFTELIQGYELRSYDNRMKTRASFSEEGSIDQVVLVDIDLSSIEAMGNYYDWPHAYHGQLIDVMSSGNPNAVMFDIIFDPKSTYEHELVGALASELGETEKELHEAAGQYLVNNDPYRLVQSTFDSPVIHHSLVIERPDTLNYLYPMDSIPEAYDASEHVLKIPPEVAKRLPTGERIGNLHFELLNAAHHMGAANFPADADGIIRRAPTAIHFDGSGDVFPSITMSAVMDILDIPPDGLDYDLDNNILRLNNTAGETIRIIPVDDQGRMPVNYFGPFKTFTYIPYLYCFDPEMLDPTYWEGKVAIVGSSLAGLGDLKSTSVQKSFPGPEIHANVIHSILQNDFVKPVSSSTNLRIVILLSCLLGLVSGVPGKPFWGFGFLILFGASWVVFATGQFLNHGMMWDVVKPVTSLALTQLSLFSFTFLVMDRDKRFLKDTFGTYISPELIEQMVEGKEEPKLGGDEAFHTAFFTDVQDFSTISEQLTATDLVELLNVYLTDMTTILLENQGTLDKYIGDAIVAFYGAPVPIKDHAYKACKTALEMQERLELLRKEWINEGERWPEIVHSMQNRIGIHSGPMVTGNMGSEQRMNYTMMGDAVNLAARLESSCKFYGIYTQITEDTYAEVKDKVVVREMDRIIVKGRNNPVTTYELISLSDQQPEYMKELLPGFQEALELYRSREWEKAVALFSSLEKYEKMVPGRSTNPCSIYSERCRSYEKNPPPENWDGVTKLKSK